MTAKHLFIAISGASGAIYGIRLVEELLKHGFQITFTASKSGQLVCYEETGINIYGKPEDVTGKLSAHFGIKKGLTVVDYENFFVPAASGSSAPTAMIIAPCSMGTLARIANGISANLIERSADVMLKERRPLLLLPRETPLSDIHLHNMLTVSRAGAQIIPAMPAFYHQPQTIDDLVNFVVGKILDQLAIKHTLFKRWGE